MHSPSHADVSDIWNFVKGYDVDGPIGAAPASSSSEVASSSDVAKSSSSVAGPGSSSSAIHWGGNSSTTALPEDMGLHAVSVYKSSDNFIVVAGAQGKTITVFNSLGSVVSTTRGTAGAQKVYTGAKGMYIVKVGGKSFKTSL